MGLATVIGTGAGTIQLDDMEQSDFTLLIGGNPASNHPRMMRTLMTVRRKGGKVVVVNPIVETGLVNFSVPSDPWALFSAPRSPAPMCSRMSAAIWPWSTA